MNDATQCAPNAVDTFRPHACVLDDPSIDHNEGAPTRPSDSDPPIRLANGFPLTSHCNSGRPRVANKPGEKPDRPPQLLVMVGHVNRGAFSQCTCDSEPASVIERDRLLSARGRRKLRVSPAYGSRHASPWATFSSRLGRGRKAEKPEEKSPVGANSG